MATVSVPLERIGSLLLLLPFLARNLQPSDDRLAPGFLNQKLLFPRLSLHFLLIRRWQFTPGGIIMLGATKCIWIWVLGGKRAHCYVSHVARRDVILDSTRRGFWIADTLNWIRVVPRPNSLHTVFIVRRDFFYYRFWGANCLISSHQASCCHFWFLASFEDMSWHIATFTNLL